jgi:hypothetical protein
MGSGFPVPRNPEPYSVPVPGNIHLYIKILFLKRGHILYYKERKYVCSLEFLGTGMHIGSRVPRNPEPIPSLSEKAVDGYVNTPLCLKMHKNGL